MSGTNRMLRSVYEGTVDASTSSVYSQKSFINVCFICSDKVYDEYYGTVKLPVMSILETEKITGATCKVCPACAAQFQQMYNLDITRHMPENCKPARCNGCESRYLLTNSEYDQRRMLNPDIRKNMVCFDCLLKKMESKSYPFKNQDKFSRIFNFECECGFTADLDKFVLPFEILAFHKIPPQAVVKHCAKCLHNSYPPLYTCFFPSHLIRIFSEPSGEFTVGKLISRQMNPEILSTIKYRGKFSVKMCMRIIEQLATQIVKDE